MSTRLYRMAFHTTKYSPHEWTVGSLCEVSKIPLALNHGKLMFNL